MEKELYSKLKSKEKYFIVELTSVTPFEQDLLEKIVMHEKYYKETPFLYLVNSYLKNYTLKDAKNKFSYLGHYNSGDWRIYKFQKN